MTFSRPTWADTWMAVARRIGERSLCDRDQVGAVIVSAENRIIDTGYNGPPRNHPGGKPIAPSWTSRTCTEWCPRGLVGPVQSDYSDCPALHAEANALMFSDRRLREGGTIYVSSGTCSGCAKLVANSGLKRAVYAPGPAHRDSERWYEFLRECGLEVVIYGTAERQAAHR